MAHPYLALRPTRNGLVSQDFWQVARIQRLKPWECQKDDVVLFYVKDGYFIKDKLKEHGYRWDNSSNLWFLEINAEEEDEEIEFLNSLHASYDISKAAHLTICKVAYIIATGETHNAKEALKENGFRYHKTTFQTCWKKKSSTNDVKDELKRLQKTGLFPGVVFQIQD